MDKVFDKVFFAAVCHECGHALYWYIKHPHTVFWITVDSNIKRIDGHTHILDNDATEDIMMLQAGNVMEALVNGRDVVNHRGTDAERSKAIATPFQIREAQQELVTLLSPYIDQVRELALQIDKDNPLIVKQITISDSSIKEICQRRLLSHV